MQLLNTTTRESPIPHDLLPVLAKGFRPFFLLAALYAVVMVPLWLAMLNGEITTTSTYLEPVTWHAHEMIWGFVVAVVAGFLLTAVGNWTQRETATGAALAGLVLLWLAGRLALLFTAVLPRGGPALVDLAFLPALAIVLARPLLATNNRRNFVMIAVLAALFAANLVVHLDALTVLPAGSARYANLASVDLIVLLIMIIGGRVFPTFTRNATGVGTIRSVAWLDRTSLFAMAALLLVDVIAPGAVRFSAVLAGIAGLLAAGRAVHWGARHALGNPLLWVLHAGYGWLVIGLLLRGASGTVGTPFSSVATHALTVGAVGTLTLGMMARVSLGHTGRALAAPRAMTWSFVAITLAALVRVLVPWLAPVHYGAALVAAGVLWVLAFGIFLATYAPVLCRRRLDGKPG